jgi:hypothetical protein
LDGRNPTSWNGIQPSEKWPGLAGAKWMGEKKSPLFGGPESIFLEEDRGDRKHDAASRHFRPMMSGDSSHPDGA